MENQSLTDPSALSVLGVSESAACWLPHRTRPGRNLRFILPVPLCVGVTGPYLKGGAEWTGIPKYFRGSEPRNSALLQTGSRLTLGLTVPGLQAPVHPGKSFQVGSPVFATTNMECLGWVAELLRVLKSAPYLTKLQKNANVSFLFFFFKKYPLYVHN